MPLLKKAQTQSPAAIPHLWQIAAAGDIDQLGENLNRGGDVNATNPSGLTPLMVAAYHGRIEMVRALIERGADVNAADDEGLTAAMLADDAGHDEIVRMLVGRAVKRKRSTAAAPETSQLQSADETAAASAATEEPPPRVAAVRTLQEPPDIWDMVHENRTEFNPGSTFFGRLTLRHSLIGAAILLIVSGGVVLCLVALRRSSSNDTAKALAPAANNTKSSVVAELPRRNQPVPDKPVINKAAGAVPAISSLFDSKKLAAGVAGLRAPNFVAPREQVPIISSAEGGVALSHSDDKKKTQKSNLPTGLKPTVAALEKRDGGQTLGSRSDKEKAATAAQKEIGKVPTPGPISPPKPNPTPKGKVIQWP